MSLSVTKTQSDVPAFENHRSWKPGLYEQCTGAIFLVNSSDATLLVPGSANFLKGEHFDADQLYLRPYYGTVTLTNTKD